MTEKKEYRELTVLSGIAIVLVLSIHANASALNSLYSGTSYAQADLFCELLQI